MKTDTSLLVVGGADEQVNGIFNRVINMYSSLAIDHFTAL